MGRLIFCIVVMLTSVGVQAGALSRAEDADKPVEIIFEIPNAQKDALFTASKTWIAETFISGKTVIDSAEKDSGTIIAKGYIKRPCDGMFDCLANGNKLVGFKLRIDTKDGKVRTTYGNFTIYYPGTSGSLVGNVYTPGTDDSERPLIMQGDLDATKSGVAALTENLKNYLAKESASKSDW